MYKNFACFKNENKKEGQPDYRLTVNMGTKEEPKYVDCGAGWIKDGAKGKFISFSLGKPYQDRPGFNLVVEKGEDTPEKPAYPEGEVNLDDIPFN